ncbi:MAG: glycosyl hydrolase [Kiritimatiellaeota bacterium]|nr:glycosyl hydrolase [Kiritimatiellota bacterium]
MKKKMLAVVVALVALLGGAVANDLERGFAQPPHAAKPWVFWFWINGNISKEGITADLEALQRAGIGGLIWMEVSGMAWAPDGKVTGCTPEWHECMQWAFRECGRLGLEFDLSLDFGYGSGGPHITPDRSMQKLYWSETEIAGGQQVNQVLPKPEVSPVTSPWSRVLRRHLLRRVIIAFRNSTSRTAPAGCSRVATRRPNCRRTP